ncbi:DNA-(apurinic or apyrimidinic site) lyase [Coniosporium tulheliwenetii]|uniref:DNA-(Apurinic or apyrimidinic site) lyase n=1 Tax=Coniosporium tulheliwenetii TaxID=3383036 RepID=A0ACC2ZMF5_9PEZI|nr:DNA-(apurinic or apyrimidinic site) lyase [Cladosporium sp. JES 115]
MACSSSSELSSAASDIAEDRTASTAPTSVEVTQEEETSLTVVSKPASKGRKRVAEEVSVPAKRARRAKGPQPKYAEETEGEDGSEAVVTTLKKRGQAKKASATVTVAEEVDIEIEVEAGVEATANGTPAKPKKRAKKTKSTIKEEVKIEEQDGEDGTVIKKVKRKRKTKEEKEAEAMPLAARTVGTKLLVGAHVSSAGGVHNAIANCVHIGGNALALFLKSQRKWANPPLDPTHTTLFASACTTHSYSASQHIVPHGSYLVNLAHTDAARTSQAYDAFLDDLARCHKLGIRLYNFHPGNSSGAKDKEEAIAHLAANLNRAHKDPSSGAVDLAAVIGRVEAKERVGVCLDTCHVFAAGYDLRSPAAFKATVDEFDSVVGLRYLRALHVNDSKAPLGSGRDLHANIGTGCLGLRAFWNVVNEQRLVGLPMVLETPIDVKDPVTGKEVPDKGIWAREIKLLEGLVGMDAEGEEFARLEGELAEKGRAERERIQAQVDKREDKRRQKAEKGEEGRGGRSRGRVRGVRTRYLFAGNVSASNLQTLLEVRKFLDEPGV